MEHQVIRQSWTESESGWGQRPDGYTIHLNEADMRAFNQAYWNRENKRNPSGRVPDIYSRPDENPHKVWVDESSYQKLIAQKNQLTPTDDAGPGLWHDERLRKVE